jgi:hypothetical protein
MKGIAARVRELLQGLPRGQSFSPALAARKTGLTLDQVCHILASFLGRGEVERTRKGRYRYLGAAAIQPRSAPAKQRQFRAMHIRHTFTAGEIALLADAKRDYVYEVIRDLLESGEVEKTGKRKGGRDRLETVYGIRNKDDFFRKHLIAHAKWSPGG